MRRLLRALPRGRLPPASREGPGGKRRAVTPTAGADLVTGSGRRVRLARPLAAGARGRHQAEPHPQPAAVLPFQLRGGAIKARRRREWPPLLLHSFFFQCSRGERESALRESGRRGGQAGERRRSPCSHARALSRVPREVERASRGGGGDYFAASFGSRRRRRRRVSSSAAAVALCRRSSSEGTGRRRRQRRR